MIPLGVHLAEGRRDEDADGFPGGPRRYRFLQFVAKVWPQYHAVAVRAAIHRANHRQTIGATDFTALETSKRLAAHFVWRRNSDFIRSAVS
jgi:hypothetical protein